VCRCDERLKVKTEGSTRRFVYFESRKRESKKRRKSEYRCDERRKTKDEESTCLVYTGLHEELEHPKIKTRLISVNLVNVMGEYAIEI
jgi:hypothetical protein